MALWGLHNALKGWTLYDLTVSEVQLLVHVMSANEVRLSKVCMEEAKVWVSLTPEKFPQFFKTETQPMKSYPPLHQIEKSLSAEVDTDYFIVRPRKQLPRLHKRHEIEVWCTINSTSKSIEIESVNLSDGGLQFKDTLPDWIAGYFIIVLKLPKGNVQLMCSLVEDQKEKKRVQIVSEDTDPQYLVYRDWLASLPD